MGKYKTSFIITCSIDSNKKKLTCLYRPYLNLMPVVVSMAWFDVQRSTGACV